MLRLRRAIRSRCRRIVITAVSTLVIAAGLTFEVLLIQTPGDADATVARWVGTILLGTGADGLEPFAASWSVAAVAATVLVAFAIGHSPLRHHDDNDTARAVVMDHLLTMVAFIGAVVSWMLVQVPTPDDPRAVNLIGPVLAALLCSALGVMSDQSAGSQEYGRLRASEARRNLRLAVAAYTTSLGREPANPGATTWLKACARIPWTVALSVNLLWAIGALSLATARGNLDLTRTAGVLILALFGFIWSIGWISTSADSQVGHVVAGRHGWGTAPITLWMASVLFTGVGLALTFVDWRYGILPGTFGVLPVVSWVLQVTLRRPRKRYLEYVHDKLSSRLAVALSRTGQEKRRLARRAPRSSGRLTGSPSRLLTPSLHVRRARADISRDHRHR